MVLVFHHVIIFFLLSDWLIQILPPFWFCCDVACFCFGSETQLKCTYRRCCQFFKNIVLCLDVLSGRESASMATFFFMTLLLFSRMLSWSKLGHKWWYLKFSLVLEGFEQLKPGLSINLYENYFFHTYICNLAGW